MRLQVEELSAGYEEFPVIESVSLQVAAGEIHAVIGPNGAGKSTLIRVISGLLPAQSGRIRVSEQVLSGLDEQKRARLIAVVPQARALPGNYTVFQTVLLGRTPYLNWFGQPQPEDLEQVRWALDKTGCADLPERLVGELSGGEQQRVLLARALAQATPVLLLDEPTTHLDLKYQYGLLRLVRDLAREKELAVLMVLHDLNLVSAIADQVTLLAGGRVRASGPPGQVLRPHHLSRAYQVPIDVVAHPTSGAPLVLPPGDGDADLSESGG